VQVPDAEQNAFDLVVADHCLHFSPAALHDLVERAGFDVVALRTDWVPKELSLVACAGRGLSAAHRVTSRPSVMGQTAERLAWLQAVVSHARNIARQRPFGIFGTSIAAVWLFGELRDVAEFFVDEDPHRAGGTFMDRPIYHPRDVPAGSHVFLGLAPELADRIQARLAQDRTLDITLYVPPRLAPVS
jgi:hypothetical protein